MNSVYIKFVGVFQVIILIIAFNDFLSAQTIISGKAPSYAGDKITFKICADPFTQAEKEVGSSNVFADGSFSVRLDINNISLVYSNLGIYKGFLYAKPGNQYVITLPDKTEKSSADKLNPFFEELEFRFPIINKDNNDLNFLISSFDNVYAPYFSLIVSNINSENNKYLLDSANIALTPYVNMSGDAFFKTYTEYKIALLKYLTNRRQTKIILNQYFQFKPVLYNNPAYMELFNQIYLKYFFIYSHSKQGKPVVADINEAHSYSALQSTLLKDSILFNDSLRELVIIKNIYDEYYSTNYSQEALLIILDSLISQTKIEKNKEIAVLVKYKITKLIKGYQPPAFELYDRDGKLLKLQDFKGHYVYLNFCACNNYACIKEFDLIKRLYEKYQDKLTIITVSCDEKYDEMKEFLKKSDYSWIFLYYGNKPDILKEYDIRAYPTYFLISPDGKLIYSPSASPGENFEFYLFRAMRANGDI